MPAVPIVSILAAAWAAQPVRPAANAAPDQVVVRGRILDPAGAPIRSARVRGGSRTARTDPRGRFSLRLARAGVLWIDAEGRRQLRVRYRMADLGRRLDLGDLVLARGHTLAGRVVDEGGKPVPGVGIELTDLLGGTVAAARQARVDTVLRTVSGPDGRFRLHGAPRGALELRASAGGRFTVRLRPVESGASPTLVSRSSGHVAGRVLDADGRPTRARLRIVYELEDASQEVATAADGRFRVTHAYPVGYVVTAGSWSLDGRRSRTELLFGPREDLVLRLPAPADPLRLRVSDPQGRSAARVRAVCVSGAASDDELSDLLAEAPWRTTEEGEVLLRPGVQDVPLHVAVQAPGSAPRFLHDLAPPAPGSSPLEIRLSAGAVLAGRVVDATTRRPLEGVHVWARAPVSERPSIELPRAGDPVPPRAVRTDAAGGFVLRLAPGIHDVVLVRPDRPPFVLRGIDLRESEREGGNMVIPMPRGVTLRGVLYGEGAEPPSPARVRLEHVAGMGLNFTAAPLFDREVEVAPDGTFSAFGLGRGTWRAWLVHPRPPREGPRLETFLDEFDVGEPDGELEVMFDRASARPAVLVGRLRQEGRTVPWSRIALCAMPPGSSPTRPWKSLRRIARHVALKPDGGFALPVPPGRPFDPIFVDVATGVVLAQCGTVEGLPGERIPCEAAVRAARITVQLRAADRIPAARLEIRTSSEAVDNPSASIFRRDDMDLGVGLRLEAGQTSATFWVPPGRVRVLARSIRQRLAPRTARPFREPLAVAEIRAAPGDDHVMTLGWTAPAEVR